MSKERESQTVPESINQTEGIVLVGVLEILIGAISLFLAAVFIWIDSSLRQEFQITVPVALFFVSAIFFITLGLELSIKIRQRST